MRVAFLLANLIYASTADQRHALSKIYTSTQGANWKNNDRWMSEEHYCNWFGVECRNGLIVEIKLSANNLAGRIPKEVGFLTDIETLHLSSNAITGSIPSQLGNLNKANDLIIENTLICGDVPVEAANEALFRKWKIVKNNPHIRSDCDTIQGIQRTRKLSAWGTGCSTPSTDVFTTLQEIYTSLGGSSWTSNTNWGSGCPCDGGDWYGLSCSGGEISEIYLKNNNLAGSLPDSFDTLTTVSDIKLSCNSITGSLPDTIGVVAANLDSLDLANNHICGQICIPVSGADYGIDQLFHVEKDFEILGNDIGTACYAPTAAPTISQAPSVFNCGMDGEGAESLCCLYESTVGADWTMKTNWMKGKPCTAGWYGVTCDNVGTDDVEVVSIKLDDNNLDGYICTEMGLLTDLGHFNLQSNKLTQSIPSELGMYTKLTSMFGLGDNDLTGTIPTELGSLTGLTKNFLVYENKLSGCIPSELGELTELTSNFRLQSNELTCTIPTELGELSLMTLGFSVGSNTLTGPIPTELGSMTGLTRGFYLQSNKLSGCIPSELGEFTEITSAFDLKGNSLSCSIPTTLGQMSNMESYFFLHSNQLTGSVPSEFGQWTNPDFDSYTNAFNLKNNMLCGDIPDEVTALSITNNVPCVDEPSCGAWEIAIDNSIGTPCPE